MSHTAHSDHPHSEVKVYVTYEGVTKTRVLKACAPTADACDDRDNVERCISVAAKNLLPS